MKARFACALQCECGLAMLNADRPFGHLCYCINKQCPHYGELVEIPTVELTRGKAFPPK